MIKFSARLNSLATLSVFFLIFALLCQPFGNASIVRAQQAHLDLLLPFNPCSIYEFKEDMPFDKAVASDNDKILIYSKNGKLVYLNINEFSFLWESNFGLRIISNIAFDADSIFLIVANEEGYILKQVSKTAGVTQWQTRLDFTADFSDENKSDIFMEIIKDKAVFVSRNRQIFCFDKQAKKLIWNRSFGDNFSSVPFSSGDSIFVSASNKTITKISVADGTTIMEAKAPTIPLILSALPNGMVVYGDKTGNVYSLNKTGKTINWKVRLGAEITDITQTRFGLLISSFDNFAYLLQNNTGKRVWKRKMPERVLQKPLVLDDYVVMTNSFEPEAVVVDLRTGKAVNSVRLYGQTENFFTGDIISDNNLLVFSTINGLVSYSTSPGNCRKTINNQ